jgi:hypothetical protein
MLRCESLCIEAAREQIGGTPRQGDAGGFQGDVVAVPLQPVDMNG